MIHKSTNAKFHQLFHFRVDTEMLEVALFQLFTNLGKNLLILGLPFYLYTTLHYEVWEILFFYFLWQLAFSLTIPFIGILVRKIGIKHSMSISALGEIALWGTVFSILTGDLVSDGMLMMPIFLFRSVCMSSKSISYDIFLTHHLNKKKKGEVFAALQILIMFASMLAPILGAFMTIWFGVGVVIYLAVICFLIGSLVLFCTPDEKVRVPYTPKKLLSDVMNETPVDLFYSQFGWVFYDTVLWVIWPIFLIMFLGDLVSMSVLVAGSSVLSMLVAYVVGKRIDTQRNSEKKILRQGALRSVFINLFRALALSPFPIFVVDFLNKVNWQTINVPHDCALYSWLHKKNTFERSHIRWLIVENCYMFSLLILMSLYLIFNEAPTWLFGVIFMASGFSLLLVSRISEVGRITGKR